MSSNYRVIGTIKKVMFYNPETNFYIVSCNGELISNKDNSRKNVEWFSIKVFNCPQNLMEDVEYEFFGELEHDAKYKKDQLICNAVNIRINNSNEGIIKFVRKTAKKFKKGKPVGEATIKKIVDKYGKDTWDMIMEHPEDVVLELKDKGIKDGHIERLQDLYSNMKGSTEVMTTLTQLYELRSDVAANIVKALGEKTLQTIQTNPYVLCKINGVGFKTIDTVAIGKVGIDPKSPERIKEGVVYTLKQNEQEGHLFIYFEGSEGIFNVLFNELGYSEKVISDLKEKGIKIGDVDECEEYKLEVKEYKTLIKEAIEDLCSNDKRVKSRGVWRENSDGGKYESNQYYLTDTYYDELNIADKLTRMAKTKLDVDLNLVDKIIDEVETHEKIKLSEEQRNGVKLALQHRIFVLTGSAGCGKTTMTKVLIKVIKKFKEKNGGVVEFVLAAPTGMASKRMKDVIGMTAKTLHTTLGYKYGGIFHHKEDNKLECDEMIVDEVSMIGNMMCSAILKALPEKARLILIGDPNQLPSIDCGNVLHNIIDSGVIPKIKLTKIFRQSAEKKLIQHAHNILAGKTPDIPTGFNKTENLFKNGHDTIFLERNEVFDRNMTDDEFILKLTNQIIPKYYPNKEIQILTPQKKRGNLSSSNINKILQESFNPKTDNKNQTKIVKDKYEYYLREGDKIIHTKNNNEILHKGKKKRINNGEIGKIKKIFTDNGKLLANVEYHGYTVQYNKTQMKELELAYAITIHKSQGSEFPITIICLDKGTYFEMLQRGLIYTAVTRGKELVIVYGDRQALAKSVKNNKVVRRRTHLTPLLQMKM